MNELMIYPESEAKQSDPNTKQVNKCKLDAG